MLRKITLLCLFCIALATSVHAQQKHIPGQLFVQLQEGSGDISYPNSNGSNTPTFLQNLIPAYGITAVNCPFILKNAALKRTYLLTFNDTTQTDKLISDLESSGTVTYAERVPAHYTSYVPNDPQYNTQWHLQTVQAELAWDLITTQTANVVIAIVDDAVLLSHEDLQPNIWTNPGETPGDGIDNDNNGYIDDVNGWDAADNDNNANPDNPTNSFFTHGTHCAGIASARTDNNIGIASLGYHAQIMPVKTATLPNPGAVVAGYLGVQYAIVNDADVISMSWGGSAYSATYQLIFDQAYAQNIVCVAAAGNSNTSLPMYPASYNHVISVGATDQNDQKAGFSNYGNTIDVMAPGVAIYSSLAGSNSSYGNLQGTSMACPLVSGLCAMLLACDPNLTPDDVENCIESTADDIYPQNPGYIGQLGAGRINAANAVACVKQIVARFEANFTTACPNQPITFTDQSTSTPVSWEWSFPGGTPATSTLQNPTVSYAASGTYDVTLIVSDGTASDTLVQTAYITIAIPNATLSGNSTILPGFTSYLQFDFTGNPPWSVTFTDGINATTLNNIPTTPYYHPVTPSATTTYTITAFSDSFCAGTFSGSSTVTILPPTASTSCYYTKFFGDVDNQNIADSYYDIIQDAIYSTGKHGTNSGLFCRFDPQGNLTFAVEYPNISGGFAQIAPAPNGDFLLLGSDNEDLILVRVDNQGNFLWGKRYDNNRERFPVLIPSAGDSYIIGCWYSTGGSSDDAVVFRVDNLGNILWTHRWHSIDDQIYDLHPNGTGGAIVSGGLHGGGSVDMFVGEYDVNGNFIASAEYNSSSFVMNEAFRIIKTMNNEYVTVSRMNTVNAGPWKASIKRLDSNFDLLWEVSFTNANGDIDYVEDVVEDMHGSLYVVSRYIDGAPYTGTVTKFDGNGNYIWTIKLTDTRTMRVLTTGSTPTDNLILARSMQSATNFGGSDLFLSRTDTALNSCSAVPATTTFLTGNFSRSTLPFTVGTISFTTTSLNYTPSPITYQTSILCENCIPDSACTYLLAEQKISDTQGNFQGTLTGTDQFGTSVCAIGDLNGDGIQDLAVGAAFDDENGNNRGAVWILFMNTDGTVQSEQKINDSNGGFTGVLDDDDLFGVRVAAIGDFNGDNIPDIAVGADTDDDGGFNHGAVYLLYLNANGTVNGHSKISDTQGNFNGLFSNYCRFGSAIANMGDLNNDGVTDLAVGMERDNDGGTNRGAFFILFMNANGTVNTFQKVSDTQGGFNGVLDDDDRFGISLANMGDMNGDNVPDLAVGAFNDDDGGSDRGAVWILFMNANGTVLSESKISETQGNFSGNLDNQDQFGVSLSGMGDLDYNGVPDLLVSPRNDDDGGTDRGAAYLLLLDNNNAVSGFLKISSTQGNFNGPLDDDDIFGRAVANIGDLNLDGFDDIAIGAFHDDDGGTNHGAVYILMLEDSCNTTYPCNLTADFSYSNICTGDTVLFTDQSFDPSANVDSWQWDFGDGSNPVFGAPNPTHIYSATGTYTVTLIVGNDATPECYDTTAYTITITDQPVLSMPSDTTICSGDSLMLMPEIHCASPFGWTYSWTPSSGLSNSTLLQPSASPSTTTTYTLTATNGTTTLSGSITITVNPNCCVTHAGFSTESPYCIGDTVEFVNISTTSGTPTWQWDFGSAATPQSFTGENPPPVIFNGTGAFTITLTLTDDCGTSTMQEDILIYPGPVADAGPDKLLCNPGSVEIGDSTNADYQYEWSPANLLDDATNAHPLATVNTDETFIVTVTDNFTGCTATDTMQVIIQQGNAVDFPDQGFCAGDTLILNASYPQSTYLWNDGTTTPTLTVTQPGQYSVTVTNACATFTDVINVTEIDCDTVCSFFLPNVFSPNGDGYNDIFRPEISDNCTDGYILNIFNRWGQLIFTREGFANGYWDGRHHNGNSASEGTYYYILTTDKRTYTGYVTLVR